MVTELGSEWETDTGLVSNFDGDVVEAWFGTNEKSTFDPDKLYLWFKFVNIETDNDSVIDELTVKMSIGNGWETADGGQRIVREDGNELTRVNSNTGYGKFIDRCRGAGKEGADFGEGFLDLRDHLAGKSPRRADIWVGHRFHVADSTYVMKDRDTQEETSYTISLPTAYLGAAKIGGAPKVEETTETSNGNGGAPDLTLIKLTALAKGKDTHQEFLDAALAVDGVATDDDLLAKVADDSPAGLYAQARS